MLRPGPRAAGRHRSHRPPRTRWRARRRTASGSSTLWPLTAWSSELVGRTAGAIVSSVTRPGRTPAGPGRSSRREMWERLNATWNALPERQQYARWIGPHASFPDVEGPGGDVLRAARRSTMSGDETPPFDLLGRSVERVQMVVLACCTVAGRGCGIVVAGVAVRCCRSAGAEAPLPTDLCASTGGFLLPASNVPAAAGREAPIRAGQPAQPCGSARRPRRCALLGRARSELEFLRPDELSTTCRAAHGPAGDHPRRRRGRVRCSPSTLPRGWRGPRWGMSERASERLSQEPGGTGD